MNLLNSRDALLKISDTDDEIRTYRRGGIKSLAKGALGGIVGYGALWVRDQVFGDFWMHTREPVVDAVGYVAQCLLALPALYAMYRSIDGISALTKKHDNVAQNGEFYLRNGAFTARPTGFDEWFGQKVVPIESVSDLKSVEDIDLAFLNGVQITDVRIDTEMEVTGLPSPTFGSGSVGVSMPMLDSDTDYFVRMYGEFKGDKIRADVFAEERDDALEVLDWNRNTNGNPMYILAEMKKNEVLNVSEYGKAFV